jgi:hypothetical protein
VISIYQAVIRAIINFAEMLWRNETKRVQLFPTRLREMDKICTSKKG